MSAESKAKLSSTRKKLGLGCASGAAHPMFGRHHTEETRAKLSASNSGEKHVNWGKHLSPETRAKISAANRGEKNAKYGKTGPLSIRYGKHHTPEAKLKNSIAHSGEQSPCWWGGASFEPYCPKFNHEFRERVREFFDRTCLICGKTESEDGRRLNVHQWIIPVVK